MLHTVRSTAPTRAVPPSTHHAHQRGLPAALSPLKATLRDDTRKMHKHTDMQRLRVSDINMHPIYTNKNPPPTDPLPSAHHADQQYHVLPKLDIRRGRPGGAQGRMAASVSRTSCGRATRRWIWPFPSRPRWPPSFFPRSRPCGRGRRRARFGRPVRMSLLPLQPHWRLREPASERQGGIVRPIMVPCLLCHVSLI